MSGVPAYFTVDAGPNVHIICEGKDEAKVRAVLSGREIIVNKPAKGAHII
jgi:mevalonate pyrophosphate decarboxylase